MRFSGRSSTGIRLCNALTGQRVKFETIIGLTYVPHPNLCSFFYRYVYASGRLWPNVHDAPLVRKLWGQLKGRWNDVDGDNGCDRHNRLSFRVPVRFVWTASHTWCRVFGYCGIVVSIRDNKRSVLGWSLQVFCLVLGGV